ncbi:MAG: hypothetical protein U0Y68_21565 [Blastocatellia bacterium]
MSEAKLRCACDQFQRLEGSATTAYIAQFLTKTGADREGVDYECRACHRRWKKIEENKRPSLVQVT